MPPNDELTSRLQQLQAETGLADRERRVVDALAEALRAAIVRMEEVPPSRRQWAEFWKDRQGWFVRDASRTGRELFGLTFGDEEETLLAAEGRLVAQAIVRPCHPEDEFSVCRFVLSSEVVRRLFLDLPGLQREVVVLAWRCLADDEESAAERPPKAGEGECDVNLQQVSRPMSPASLAAKEPQAPAPSTPPVGDPSPASRGWVPPPRRPVSPSSRRPLDDPDETPEEALFDFRAPEFGFEAVILPEETLQEIQVALVQIRKHPLIAERWGLGERYRMGRGLAFNFAGPPGTGKTLTAEAVAKELGRPLMTVKYSGLESKWIGETGKHIEAVFAAARREGAVLFFDEADAIASRRTANLEGSGRHYNQSVNILLHELERYEGVVIFATNLAANFDPAFERRIQSHVLFRMPNADEREQIWQAHLPPRAPLAADVDLRQLAEVFAIAGGDIRNAMLKAVSLAALADAPDEGLCITQEHLLAAARAVLQARAVMAQSILSPPGSGE